MESPVLLTVAYEAKGEASPFLTRFFKSFGRDPTPFAVPLTITYSMISKAPEEEKEELT